jgi:signal transduction histidine kinase
VESLHVLVVDDEPGMRLGVSRALRNFTVRIPDVDDEVRFACDQAESGEQALEKITARAPDILLLDHKLPGISGLDVLQQMAEKNIEALTVMITAYASLDTAITATKRGAYDFLAKPFTPDELKSAVRKAAKHLILQRQARRLAEEKRQVRFQFISVLAHELKAPLGAVQGYLRIVRDRSAGEDMETYDKMVRRSLVRLEGMQKLIFDLLDLTRIESGQKKRDLRDEVDVVSVARESVENFTPDAGERGISIELHAPETLAMRADPGELAIIFNNLISNAVKYNRDNGRVDVTLSDEKGEIRVDVSDTGIGMSEEDVQRLFGEFVRIKNEKTRNILGSGLGLSILRRLANLYGGDVSVRSQPEVGSTFTVTLQRSGEGGDDSAPGNPALVV